VKCIYWILAWKRIFPSHGDRLSYIALVTLTVNLVATAPLSHAQQEKQVIIDIPAQPLGDALKQLGRQTSLQLFFTPDLVAGKNAQMVQGIMLPHHALDALLQGTGLEYHQDGSSLTLHRRLPEASSSVDKEAKEENAATLRELVIKEARQLNYMAEDASSATRIPVPIKDVPRSIGVITSNVIDDQKAFRIDEAIRNISGTSMPSTQGGRAGDFMIRGFRSDLNVFKNGFREDSTYGARTSRDTANIETIEVVKGPPSYLYGRADPGGIINQVTKAPLITPYYSAQMTIGSFGFYRPTIDMGGALNESKSLSYRLNAVYENAHSYRNGVQSERVFIAPTIGWAVDGQTSFRLEGEYLYDKSPIDRGIVAVGNGPAPIPVGRFLGDPSRRGTINQGKATLTFLHQINNSFKWRTAFRAATAAEKYTSLESNFLDETTGILNLARYEIPQSVQSHYLQNELHGAFSTGSIKHKALVGLELGREFQSSRTSGDFGQLGSFIDIFNPANRLFLDGPLTTFNDARQTNNALGLYFGDQIALLSNLHIHGGGRFDIFEQRINNRPNAFIATGSTDKQTDRAFSPSVGITYQPWKPLSLYANYTQSFAPQAGGARSALGTLFRPERGESYERV
jgi:iron complex outermembrane receptor protein